MPGFVLGSRSRQRLQGVHPDLIKVVELALKKYTPVDFTVIEGVRSLERQKELYAQGRTKPGPKVTWSMNSRHLRQGPDNLGKAVDIGPFDAKGNILWNDKQKFLAIGKAMFAAAMELGVPIRWGYDWDGDGILMEAGEYDGPHFELVRSKYP